MTFTSTISSPFYERSMVTARITYYFERSCDPINGRAQSGCLSWPDLPSPMISSSAAHILVSSLVQAVQLGSWLFFPRADSLPSSEKDEAKSVA